MEIFIVSIQADGIEMKAEVKALNFSNAVEIAQARFEKDDCGLDIDKINIQQISTNTEFIKGK